MGESTIVADIIEIFLAMLQGLAEGIGGALNDMTSALFFNGTALSVFGQVMVVFASVALVFALTRFITNWVTSWGN